VHPCSRFAHGGTFEAPDQFAAPYVSLFPGAEITRIDRYVKGEAGREGSVKTAAFNYGISARFGWVSDRFGVSCQLNLP
jgi:predicted 3-demethylubiquinone-9 3-methyltransferase (glyoxalase superfamily)